jgi:hypothetical protein
LGLLDGQLIDVYRQTELRWSLDGIDDIKEIYFDVESPGSG